MKDYGCALWVWTYGTPRYELCEDEGAAARMAVAFSDDGSGSVAGVQFPDGRLIERKDWTAYHEEEKRQTAVMKAALERPPRRPKGEINEPFSGERVTIWEDVPRWLGKQES